MHYHPLEFILPVYQHEKKNLSWLNKSMFYVTLSLPNHASCIMHYL